MTIHEQLLIKARAALADLADAERRLALARREYHAIVRRMHLAGGSVREIAEALELSHQRVQQMVDGAGGSWWRRVWRSRNIRGNLTCTFCGRRENEVAGLIAGPKVFICDRCVGLAEQVLAGAPLPTGRGTLSLAGEAARVRCSFCGKRRAIDRPLLTGSEANLCGQCLDVCRQILMDTPSGVPSAEPRSAS